MTGRQGSTRMFFGATGASLLCGMLLLVQPGEAHSRRMIFETRCDVVPAAYVTSGGVVWHYPAYMECRQLYSGGGSYYAEPESLAGGGGGGSRLYRARDNPYTHNRATCRSGSDDRYLHAAGDFGGWKASTKPLQIKGRGELIQIKYDDGGIELYVWIYGRIPSPDAPPESYLARVPNSLRCPD